MPSIVAAGWLVQLAILAFAVFIAGLASPAARAEWHPTKPVQFIVMAGVGGGADKATRFLVDQLALAHWFDPRPFREATGWRPEVTIADGMHRLAVFYRGEQAL